MATVTWSQLRSDDTNNLFFLLPLAGCDGYSLYLDTHCIEIFYTYNMIHITGMFKQLIIKGSCGVDAGDLITVAYLFDFKKMENRRSGIILDSSEITICDIH